MVSQLLSHNHMQMHRSFHIDKKDCWVLRKPDDTSGYMTQGLESLIAI